ncbi:MAG: PilZ domain-containing protein [Myxococcota bacterium]
MASHKPTPSNNDIIERTHLDFEEVTSPDLAPQSAYIAGRRRQGERRRYTRWPVNLALRELKPELHVMRIADLSAGGFYCPDAPPRPVGEQILVEINLEDGPLLARAKVVACVTNKDGLGGVRMAFLRPQQRIHLTFSTSRSHKPSPTYR